MGVSLVLIKHDGTQVEVELKHPRTLIGRHTDCGIRIPDASVSRQHCELALAEGRVSVRDLGSSNGTFVNRRRINQTELAANDLLNVGRFVFVVRVDGKPGVIDSEDALDDGMATPAAAAPPAPPARPQPAQGAKAAAKPAPGKGSLLGDPDDSSVADFDFLDEKDAPKL